MRPAIVYSFGDLDEYGFPTLNEELSRQVLMTFTLFTHHPVEDIRYQGIEFTGLTADTLTDNDVVEIEGNKYKVKFVNPCGRLNQVFLIRY